MVFYFSLPSVFTPRRPSIPREISIKDRESVSKLYSVSSVVKIIRFFKLEKTQSQTLSVNLLKTKMRKYRKGCTQDARGRNCERIGWLIEKSRKKTGRQDACCVC